MPRSFTRLALIVMLFAAGCASQAEFLKNNQYNATQTAVSRAQFEMNCQQVTPVIISREVVQPALQGPWVNGIQRAEYTIGVSGCGRRTTFVVICPQYGNGCRPRPLPRLAIGGAWRAGHIALPSSEERGSSSRGSLVQNQGTLLAMVSRLSPPLIKGGQGGFTGKAWHAQRGLLNMH
jgi:hypothetical protein